MYTGIGQKALIKNTINKQEPRAWLTEHDAGDMVWTDEKEACQYCDDEGPIPLYEFMQPVQPRETKLDRFLGMVRIWVERDGGDTDAALAWMYSQGEQ